MWSIGIRAVSVGGAWAAVVIALYVFGGMPFLRLPFLPIATVGTAVAFYVGFKNNAAYERFWEGRKIWGGIVNASRTWAACVLAYVHFQDSSASAQDTRRVLIYRQLAWINSLRVQLRQKSRFLQEDAHKKTKERLNSHEAHIRNDWNTEVSPFLDAAELSSISERINPATHLLNNQSQQLAHLLKHEGFELFHQIELMRTVTELYTLQGKCERIKNTPFPRQYAEFSRWFVRVFAFLVPFGLLSVFGDQITSASDVQGLLAAGVPMCFCAGLISWVFFTMEGVGDASEDPFERSMNDVPMNALCRTIERDLRQMLDETELPEPEPAAGFILY